MFTTIPSALSMPDPTLDQGDRGDQDVQGGTILVRKFDGKFLLDKFVMGDFHSIGKGLVGTFRWEICGGVFFLGNKSGGKYHLHKCEKRQMCAAWYDSLVKIQLRVVTEVHFRQKMMQCMGEAGVWVASAFFRFHRSLSCGKRHRQQNSECEDASSSHCGRGWSWHDWILRCSLGGCTAGNLSTEKM